MTERLRFLDAIAAASGSAERARNAEVAIAPVDHDGPFVVAFEDGAIHEVTLHRDGHEWHGDCWTLYENGDKRGRCKGLTMSDGPCSHLFAVAQADADDDRDDVDVIDAEEARADHYVEKLRADGGQRFDR
jgi:hypothetical protein